MLAGLLANGFPKVVIILAFVFESVVLVAVLVVEPNEIVGAGDTVEAAVGFTVFPKENPEELMTVVVFKFSVVDLEVNSEELMFVPAVVVVVLVSELDIFNVGAAVAVELENVEDGNENPPVEAGFRELAEVVEVAREEVAKLNEEAELLMVLEAVVRPPKPVEIPPARG